MKHFIVRKALSFLSVVAVASAINSAQAQTTTNLLSETTFDAGGESAWSYGYFYADDGLGVYEVNRAFYFPEDEGMTNAVWQYLFDLSGLSGRTGYGTGTGGPLFRTETDPANFISKNREDYIFSFNARVEGLAAGQNSANSEMQVQFYMPPVEAGDPVKFLQVNIPFQPTAEWKTFTFTLDQGGLGDNTSEADLALNHTNTSEVRFNVNMHEPHNAFDFDSGNTLYLDNLKLQVINRTAVPPPQYFGVIMADWNFDDKPVTSEYHFEWSQNDTHVIPTAGNNLNDTDPNTVGKDGSNGWFLNLDNTEFGNGTVPQYAGGGTGGSGPIDYSLFDTNDLALYRVSFEARVQGLAEGRTNTATVLQLHIDSADDTLQPADENTDADSLVRLDFPIAKVGTNWQTYTFTLNKGTAGTGSKDNFITYHTNITALRTQWQIENIASQAEWGFDAENSFIIDNFKLERLVTGLGGITAVRNGDNLVLTWAGPTDGSVKLQSSATVEGPYSDVAGASSGYSTPLTSGQRFFRLTQISPIP
jgi:hypothetical protein